MERKRYLELCQLNAVRPRSVVVQLDGVGYYPVEYRLRFDTSGKTIHTVVLRDICANSIINSDLEKVKEYEEKSN